MHLRILQIKLFNFFYKNRERICVPENAYAPLKHNYALRYEIQQIHPRALMHYVFRYNIFHILPYAYACMGVWGTSPILNINVLLPTGRTGSKPAVRRPQHGGSCDQSSSSKLDNATFAPSGYVNFQMQEILVINLL